MVQLERDSYKLNVFVPYPDGNIFFGEANVIGVSYLNALQNNDFLLKDKKLSQRSLYGNKIVRRLTCITQCAIG